MALRIWLSIVLCLVLLAPRCFAQEAQGGGSPQSQGEAEALRKELEELKQEYEERIRSLEERQAAAAAYRGAPVGTYGGIMNPDISIVVDVQALFTDDKDNDNRNKVRIPEAELALQAFLYPGVRADFVAAFEQHYEGDNVETEVDIEEAYASFLDLPFGMQLEAGRKLMNLGKFNPVHPHHWRVAQTPLVLEHLFGHHPWYDDGAQLSVLVPNPWDLYAKAGFGIFNGKDPGHAHEQNVDWDGHVYLARSSFDLPVSDEASCVVGYSAAWDEGGNTALHDVDATLNYRWPMTYRKLKWHNELIYADIDDINTNSLGLFSILSHTLDKYWEIGLRYDWAELLHDDDKDEWAAGAFLTYYFTHSMYLRGEYRYTDRPGGDKENAFIIQFVWGLGPHAHRIED